MTKRKKKQKTAANGVELNNVTKGPAPTWAEVKDKSAWKERKKADENLIGFWEIEENVDTRKTDCNCKQVSVKTEDLKPF